MIDGIDDEMLDRFAVVGEVEEVAPKVLARFGDLVDRFAFYAPYPMPKQRWREVVAALTRG